MDLTVFSIPARASLRDYDDCNHDSMELYSVDKVTDPDLYDLGEVNIERRTFHHYVGRKESIQQYLTISDAVMIQGKRGFVKPQIMAIVNATPDSFYSGSRHMEPDTIIDRILDEKPDFIDIGGESTRPGSSPVDPHEEIARIQPVIDYVRDVSNIPVSLDTRHWQVAEHFIDHISMINDISGFTDPDMRRIAATYGKDCVIMHMRGTPSDMQDNTEYYDLIGEVAYFLQKQAMEMEADGIGREHIILDPGLGFAKNSSGNFSIVRNIRSFQLGYRLLVGPSRKSFIGRITGKSVEDRLAGTIAVSAYLAQCGVDILRVHDPSEIGDSFLVLDAIYKAP